MTCKVSLKKGITQLAPVFIDELPPAKDRGKDNFGRPGGELPQVRSEQTQAKLIDGKHCNRQREVDGGFWGRATLSVVAKLNTAGTGPAGNIGAWQTPKLFFPGP